MMKKIDRRKFLRSSALIAGGVTAASLASHANVPTDMPLLKLKTSERLL